MKILAIETSCDETAIAVVDAKAMSALPTVQTGDRQGDEISAQFTILGNVLLSQTNVHALYGGVFPALAKREHAKNLMPILESVLEKAELLHKNAQTISEEMRAKISEILAREPGLAEAFFNFIKKYEPPDIDIIVVTRGPGLEPALWVGINLARAISIVWNKPLIGVNHMEGHVMASLAAKAPNNKLQISSIGLPVLALLISGGHTELVLMKKWLEYELVGQTRDDAVGEAYDKVARMLDLPYPGGPEISHLAEQARMEHEETAEFWSTNASHDLHLPRPMIHDANCDLSFAGLKTAVLYLLKNTDILREGRSDVDKDIMRSQIAVEFENAVADVLWNKTARALEITGAQTLIIGGGVSANTHIRRVFTEQIQKNFPNVLLSIPARELSTDNAVMIALSGFYRAIRNEFASHVSDISASGNLSLSER